MFLRIVAEMTTKNKGYDDVFSEVTDSKALRIAVPPLLRIALRSSSDNPPHTPYSVFSGFLGHIPGTHVLLDISRIFV